MEPSLGHFELGRSREGVGTGRERPHGAHAGVHGKPCPPGRHHHTASRHQRGASQPHPTQGLWERGIHATSHRRGTGEVVPCHVPPRGHLPSCAAWDRFSTGVPALTYISTGATVGAAGASPPQCCDVGRCQQHLQERKKQIGGGKGEPPAPSLAPCSTDMGGRMGWKPQYSRRCRLPRCPAWSWHPC